LRKKSRLAEKNPLRRLGICCFVVVAAVVVRANFIKACFARQQQPSQIC